MNLETTLKSSLEILKSNGADDSSIFCSHQAFDELVYENDSFTLLRSVDEYSVDFSVIKDKKLGSYSVNQLSQDQLEKAGQKTIEIAMAGKEDEAYSFAPNREHKSFSHGPESADLDAMKKLIDDFVARARQQYPLIGLRSVTVKFNAAQTHFANSEGASSQARKSFYMMSVLFNAQEGELSSSMNYDSFAFTEFNIDFLSEEKFGKIFSDTTLHLKAEKLGKTVTGNAILTPQCLQSFLSFVLSHLGTSSLVAGTSRLKGKIGEKVGSNLLTLESRPQDSMFANPNFLTGDGLETKNISIFDQGKLNTYLVDLYGKNKLKLQEASNFASRLFMPAGDKTLNEMVKEIDCGILVGRFSGGYPNANGDFSGIAKNSFYIENGEIKQPLAETMISGNLFDLLNDLYATSSEVYENGTTHLPYIATKNITIS
jgi:PmbA protein